jgi:hypothetical protein
MRSYFFKTIYNGVYFESVGDSLLLRDRRELNSLRQSVRTEPASSSIVIIAYQINRAMCAKSNLVMYFVVFTRSIIFGQRCFI